MRKQGKKSAVRLKSHAAFMVPCGELTPGIGPLFGFGADANLEKRKIRFEDRDAYCFSKNELLALLQKSRLFVHDSRPSGKENVTWIDIEAEPPNLPETVRQQIRKTITPAPAVHLNYFEGRSRDHFAYIARHILGPVIKREILLEVPHGYYRQHTAEGPFQILVWSTSDQNAVCDRRPPTRIWNVSVMCRDSAFNPQKIDGILFNCDGYAVAELLPNALYVHHDLVHYGANEEFELFAEIMVRAAKLVASPDEYARYLEETRAQTALREQNAFVDMVKLAASKRGQRQNSALKIAEERARRLATEYFSAERDVFALRQEKADPAVMERRFMAEFEKLKGGKIDMIEGATFDPKTPDLLTVHTKEIIASHPQRPEELRLIGRCDAKYDLHTGGVRITNRDRQIELDGGTVLHTPHVFSKDGHNVCLGNIGPELRAYIAHFEIEAAAVLTVAFLQSVTNSPQYIDHFERFPLHKEAKTAKRRAA